MIKYHLIKNVIVKSLLFSAFSVLLFQSLELLCNIVEDNKQNIATLVQLRTSPCLESQEVDNQGEKISAIEALVQLFLIREKAARNTDEMTSGLSTEGNAFNPTVAPSAGLSTEGNAFNPTLAPIAGLSTEGNAFNPTLTVTKILFLQACSAGLSTEGNAFNP